MRSDPSLVQPLNWSAPNKGPRPTILTLCLQRYRYCTSKQPGSLKGRATRKRCTLKIDEDIESKPAYRTCLSIIKYLEVAIYIAGVFDSRTLERPSGYSNISWMNRNSDAVSIAGFCPGVCDIYTTCVSLLLVFTV